MLEILKNIGNAYIEFVSRITTKKWKLYIYFQKQCVKVIKVDDDEKPLGKVYALDIWFKKHIFLTNHAKVVLLPTRILFNDSSKRATHVESILYEGVDIE